MTAFMIYLAFTLWLQKGWAHFAMQLENTEWVIVLSQGGYGLKDIIRRQEKQGRWTRLQEETGKLIEKDVMSVCFIRFGLGSAPLIHVKSLYRPAGESWCETVISCWSQIVAFVLYLMKVVDINTSSMRHETWTSSCH